MVIKNLNIILNDLKLKDWCKKYNISFEEKYVIDNLERIYKIYSVFK